MKRAVTIACALSLALIAGCGSAANNPIGAIALSEGKGAISQSFKMLKPQLPSASDKRSAVLFSYIAMDDPLSPWAESFLKAIQSTANNRIHDIAFADFQGSDNSYLFCLQPQPDPSKLTSPHSYLAPGLKEVAACDPAILASTVNWAFSNYDGKFKAMDVLAHGGASYGWGTDETQPGSVTPKDCLSVAEIGKSLRSGLKGRKLNLLNMLSCLMANVEYAYELRDVAEVMIASEDVIDAKDNAIVDFTAELNRQLSAPGPDARIIARKMAIYADAKNPDSGYYTVSAIDLDKIADVKRSTNVLANALIAALPTRSTEIVAAYESIETYEGVFSGDLWQFCNALQQVGSPEVRKAALAVKASLRVVLIHARDREGQKANGLSIFMPPIMNPNWSTYPHFQKCLDCDFAKDTSWDRFLIELTKAKHTKP